MSAGKAGAASAQRRKGQRQQALPLSPCILPHPLASGQDQGIRPRPLDLQVPPACSLVLAADDPAALARFYGALVGQQPQPGFGAHHWRLPLPGGALLELYAPSRSRPLPRQRGRLAVCLRHRGPATQLDAWIDQACALGAALLEPPRCEPFGAEAWLQDPEGNGLLLLVSAP